MNHRDVFKSIIADLLQQEELAGRKSKGIYKRIREDLERRLKEIEESEKSSTLFMDHNSII